MGPSAYLALLVIVLGAVIGAGGLLFAGVLMALVLAIRSVWSRSSLDSAPALRLKIANIRRCSEF